jgi:adenylate cyclase
MDKFSPDRIDAQLERVLGSSEFMAGRRLGQFLRYVVEQALNGHSGRMNQFTIAVEAFGYGPDFDPVSNPAVRILARRLRRALDLYFSTQGSDDPIRIDIPKGGYVPVFSDNHLMPKESGSYECPTPAVEVPTLDVSRPTIAIMAFEVLNANGAFDHVATGLTEEIIIALTQFPEFLVVGPLNRSIILQRQLDTNGIGQQYGVRFLLDGTLRIHKDMLRLTVRLADTLSGQHLWGHSFDVNMRIDSMMAFQDDLVGQLVAVIADSYGIIPRTLTKEFFGRDATHVDTYEAVLYYYHYFRVLTEESYVNAMNALEGSVRQNPDHALATAALADLLASTFMFGYDEDPSNLARAEVLARKAVTLDPNCQIVRFTMAFIHFLKFDRSLFLDEARQALSLNPNNAHFIAVLSLHFGMVGEWKLAMELIHKAMRLNPHHPGWCHILAFMNYYRQGMNDLAWIEAQRFNTPDFFWDPEYTNVVQSREANNLNAGESYKAAPQARFLMAGLSFDF